MKLNHKLGRLKEGTPIASFRAHDGATRRVVYTGRPSLIEILDALREEGYSPPILREETDLTDAAWIGGDGEEWRPHGGVVARFSISGFTYFVEPNRNETAATAILRTIQRAIRQSGLSTLKSQRTGGKDDRTEGRSGDTATIRVDGRDLHEDEERHSDHPGGSRGRESQHGPLGRDGDDSAIADPDSHLSRGDRTNGTPEIREDFKPKPVVKGDI